MPGFRLLPVLAAAWVLPLADCSPQAQPSPAMPIAQSPAPDTRRSVLRSTPDIVPPFELDPLQPFHLEFGCGSGWHGLDAIIVEQSGRVTLSRQPTRAGEHWTTAQLQISPDLVAEIATLINLEKLTSLDRLYLGNVADGTQWTLFITQGPNQKAAYFDNNFPTPITRFANTLDDILKRAGIDNANWTAGGEDLNKQLWNHIEPKK